MRLLKSGMINRELLLSKEPYQSHTPAPTQQDYSEMLDDIRLHKQQTPIVVDENFVIIDGYTRLRIADDLETPKIKYTQYQFKDESEKIQFIDSKNVKRRHLNPWHKFENVFPTYEQEKIKAEKRQKSGTTLEPSDAKGKAAEIAAKKIGMASRTFERCLAIKEKATPDQIKKVATGQTAIKTMAVQVTKKDRNEPKVPLPKTISDVFLADVPYGYRDKGGRAAADEHYDTMSVEEITKDFTTLAAADNAIMFFWMSPSIQYDTVAVNHHFEPVIVDDKTIVPALDIPIQTPVYKTILDAGGFAIIKGEFVWNKKKIGVGSWNRNQHENLLIAIKGKMPVPAELFSSIIEEIRSAHSKKPDLWHMIKKMYPKRNYCELYARKKTPGVLYHGNQLQKEAVA